MSSAPAPNLRTLLLAACSLCPAAAFPAAADVGSKPVAPALMRRECLGEAPTLLCYTWQNAAGRPQHVSVDDVVFSANYLRSYGRGTRAGRMLTMLAADTPDCGEWTIYTRGTVRVAAKHIDPSVNSSVLYEDIANTIDGGAAGNADEVKKPSILDCGMDGGAFGVQANTASPAYSSDAFVAANYTASGIIIKIVHNDVLNA